jgi:hypothetical protein
LRAKLIFFEDKIIDDLDSIKINFVEEENFSEKIKEIKTAWIRQMSGRSDKLSIERGNTNEHFSTR